MSIPGFIPTFCRTMEGSLASGKELVCFQFVFSTSSTLLTKLCFGSLSLFPSELRERRPNHISCLFSLPKFLQICLIIWWKHSHWSFMAFFCLYKLWSLVTVTKCSLTPPATENTPLYCVKTLRFIILNMQYCKPVMSCRLLRVLVLLPHLH